MKNEMSCYEKEKCGIGKWIVSISAIVGFVGMATIVTLWLCKKYKKCVAPFSDDENLDCTLDDICEN
ncbi:MAG: hypothetical protein E7616_03760 [Ruminococcaceae bacterium]|nr:hypothetical protein [Oscillospiraceae bacterium]